MNMTTKIPEELSLEETRKHMSRINNCFIKRLKLHQSIKKHDGNPKGHIIQKRNNNRKSKEEQKKGTREEQPKDMRKYKKDLTDAFIIV